MRIAEISTYTPEMMGGLETVVKEIVTNLAEQHKFDIYYRGVEEEPEDYADFHPVQAGSGLRGHIEYNFKLSRTSFDADLIHAHGQNSFAFHLAPPNVPLVTTFHGTYHGLQKLRNPWRTIPIWNPLKLFDKYGAQASDKVVACSQGLKKELTKYYNIPEDKVEVIHNGVNTDHYQPIPEKEAKKELDLPADQKYFSWIGNKKRRKGFEEAVKIVEKLPDYKLLVAGHDQKDTENITYLGRVPEKQLPHFYNSSKAFLFPTKYEAHPLAVLESLGTHTPVITTPAANVEIAEKDEHHTYIEDKDVEELKEFAEKCEADFSFIEDYTWEKVAERYNQLFKELIE